MMSPSERPAPESGRRLDSVFYPESDDMGESGLQFWVCHVLGERELFRYDPEHVLESPRPGRGRRRNLLTHFVRNAEGLLVPTLPAAPDRAQSVLYDFWLVHLPPWKLRIGTGPQGKALWPTY